MIQTNSNRDTIIEEIHRTRQRMAEKFGGNIAAILEDARKRQAASGRPVWKGPSSNKATDPSGELGRRFLMEKRGDGVPIILEESRKLSGRLPEYLLIDDAGLLLESFGQGEVGVVIDDALAVKGVLTKMDLVDCLTNAAKR